jgi:hypothetical protein
MPGATAIEDASVAVVIAAALLEEETMCSFNGRDRHVALALR